MDWFLKESDPKRVFPRCAEIWNTTKFKNIKWGLFFAKKRLKGSAGSEIVQTPNRSSLKEQEFNHKE